MMKKWIFSLASLALVMSSCSNEELMPAGGTDGNVVFKVAVPENVLSRAYSNGTTATTLKYAAYEHGTTTPVIADETTGNTEFTVTMNLVKGKSYDFVFWADKGGENTPYTFDADNQSITVDYSDVAINDDSRDAFFNVVKGLEITGPMQKDVELRRPFAQINVGTSDLEAAKKVGVELKTTAIKVEGAYTELNLMSGVATNATTVTFAAGTPVAKDVDEFPFEPAKYDYLAMGYVLTGSVVDETDVQKAQSELMKVTIDLAMADNHVITIPVENAPVQRNYRTNIYGALLTSPLDWVVTIEPGYNEPDKPVVVSNGRELVNALNKGGDIIVPKGTVINMPAGTEPAEITEPTELTVNGVINNESGEPFHVKGSVAARSGESTPTLTVKGTGTINALGNDATQAFKVTDGAMLVIEDVTINMNRPYYYTESYNGSSFSMGANVLLRGGSAKLKNVTIHSANLAVRSLPLEEGYTGPTPTLEMEDCVVTSTSSSSDKNPDGSGAWSYTMILNGVEATLTNVKCSGIQGGISVTSGGNVTINGGVYATYSKTKYCYWPLYLTGTGNVTLNGDVILYTKSGVGLNAKMWLGGDNDVNDGPYGNITINGGKFSGRPWLGGNDAVDPVIADMMIEPAGGKSLNELTDETFTFVSSEGETIIGKLYYGVN